MTMPPQPQPTSRQAHAGDEPELARHEIVFGELRQLEVGVAVRVYRARVGHRRAKDPGVELIRYVIVMRDRRLVAALGVTPAGQVAHFLRRDGHALEELRPAERAKQPPPGRGSGAQVHRAGVHERRVDVAVNL
jgi:hypothetical protein